jgi:hypothetical protein
MRFVGSRLPNVSTVSAPIDAASFSRSRLAARLRRRSDRGALTSYSQVAALARDRHTATELGDEQACGLCCPHLDGAKDLQTNLVQGFLRIAK